MVGMLIAVLFGFVLSATDNGLTTASGLTLAILFIAYGVVK